MKKILFLLILSMVMLSFALLLASCEKKPKTLIVYSGQGMINPMEEIKKAFEEKYDIKIHLVYAGSNTLLSTIKNTQKGDIYIPGSSIYIAQAGDLVTHHQDVARHVPIFAIRKDNSKNIQTFDDLSRDDVRIAVGNKDMCSIGMTTDKIISRAGERAGFANNIVITASTVVELLNLVIHDEVDTSLIWKDQLQKPEAQGLKAIHIPGEKNIVSDIPVAVLTTSQDMASARLFADYVANEGKAIFIKNGFVE